MQQQSEAYFVQALRIAKINDLKDTYFKLGYNQRESSIQQGPGFDLILRNDKQNHTVAFKVMVSPLDAEDKLIVEQLRQQAQKFGYEFRVSAIARPKRYVIDIDWLDMALLHYIIENPIEEIESAATHIGYEHVEATVDSIHINDEKATLDVHGTIDVDLQYGSSTDLAKDIGFTALQTFLFEGVLEVDISTQQVANADIRVDMSDWIDPDPEQAT